MSPAHWPRPKLTNNRAGNAKRSRCGFAHKKRILKLDRLRLQGLSGAKDEVLLTATAQNLRASSNSSAARRHRRQSLVPRRPAKPIRR